MVGTYRVAHARAGRSLRARAWLLGSTTLATVLGLVAALWLPPRVPDTGSPATLVAVVLLWILGGGVALLGLVSFIGALTAHPPR